LLCVKTASHKLRKTLRCFVLTRKFCKQSVKAGEGLVIGRALRTFLDNSYPSVARPIEFASLIVFIKACEARLRAGGIINLVKKSKFDITTAEEFIEKWIELSPKLFLQAKKLHIVLENEDGTPMDPYMLFVTGDATAKKMERAGVDSKTKRRTLQLISEIQKFNACLSG
jgi:hypothetical protein